MPLQELEGDNITVWRADAITSKTYILLLRLSYSSTIFYSTYGNSYNVAKHTLFQLTTLSITSGALTTRNRTGPFKPEFHEYISSMP